MKLFRFDGVTDEEILTHRKKTNKKAAIIYCIILAVVFAVSFAVPFLLDSAEIPETFTYGEMTITLTDDFSERNYEGYSACYESYDTIVMITKDDSSYFENFEEYTLKQYGEDTLEYNEFDDYVKLKEEDGLTYFEYDAAKNKVLRNEGKPYLFSPYSLVWNGDYYYMIGVYDYQNRLGTFRVDRINKIPTIA